MLTQPIPSSTANSSRKRSRKQEINTLRDPFDQPNYEAPLLKPKSPKKTGKGAKGANAGGSKTIKKQPNKKLSKSKKGGSGGGDGSSSSNSLTSRTAPPTASSLVQRSAGAKRKQLKAGASDSSELYPERISLNQSELAVTNLAFRVFHDDSRGISAIGPSQLILAAEPLIEPGTQQHLYKNGYNDGVNFETSYLFDKLLSTPHYLPLRTIISGAHSFTRIVKFSSLEELNGGAQLKNNYLTYKTLYGAGTTLRQQRVEGFSKNTIVIKHPVFGYFVRKPLTLKFFVLKKIQIGAKTLGTLKGKSIELLRTEDLRNISIKVSEDSISETPINVNEMNQQNIQPVIHTNSGIVPVLNRTDLGHLQHQYQAVQPHQQSFIQQQQPRFQYVQYHYYTPSELAIGSAPVNLITQVDDCNITSNEYNIIDPSSSVVVPLESLVLEDSLHLETLNTPVHRPGNLNFLQGQLVGSQSQFVSPLPIQQHPEIESQVQTVSVPPTPALHSNHFVHPTSNSTQTYLHPQQQQQRTFLSQDQQIHTAVGTSSFTPNSAVHQVHPPQHQILQEKYQSQRREFSERSVAKVIFSYGEPTNKVQIVPLGPTLTLTDEELQTIIREVVTPIQAQLIKLAPHQTQEYTVQLKGPDSLPPGPPQSQTNQVSQGLVAPRQNQVQTPFTATSGSSTGNTQVINRSSQPPQPQLSTGTGSTPSCIQQVIESVVRQPNLPINQAVSKHAVQNSHHQEPVQVPSKAPQKSKAKKEPKCKFSGGVVQVTATGTVTSTSSSIAAPTAAPSTPQTPDIVRISPGSVLPNSLGKPLAGNSPATSAHVSASAGPTPKRFVIVQTPQKPVVPTTISATPSTLTTPASGVAVNNRVVRKPGFLAACPRCGFSSANIVTCLRCKGELPESVKLVKDNWSVNTSECAVISNTPAVVTGLESGKAKGSESSQTVIVPKKGKGAKKIVVVNQPAILNCPQNKAKTILAGSVQVKIQTDGGTSITYVPNEAGPTSTIRPTVAKKRAAPRRKQQVCITLSSDEEEPESEPPKSKIPKVENSNSNNNGSDADNTLTPNCTDNNSTADTTTTQNNLNPTETAENSSSEMTERKRMSINLLPEGESIKTESEEEFVSPTDVLAKIEAELSIPGSKFKFVTIGCRSIRIGSYKVTNTDAGQQLTVDLTEFGLKFAMPHSTIKRREVVVCIPMEQILKFQACLSNKRLYVIFITTGPFYAKWVRSQLGMEGNPNNEQSNFYCPQQGGKSQRSITILIDSIEEADAGIIKKLYSEKLTELDYSTANKYLMDVTPNVQQGETQVDADSPAAKMPSSGRRNNSVSSTTATSSSGENINRGERKDGSLNNSTGGSGAPAPVSDASTPKIPPNQVVDQDTTIFSYEGKTGKVPICRKDVYCLEYGQFLNDQIIDLWLAYFQSELLTEEDRKKTFVYDTFFYSKLTEKKRKAPEDGDMTAGERRHARVKKRTKNVDIFTKDFLIVPINENYHWYLAIICFPWMTGYHDFDTLEQLPDYQPSRSKRAKSGSSKHAKNLPIVSQQPQHQSTSFYSNKDEVPEDPEEAKELAATPPDSEHSGDSFPSMPKLKPMNEATGKTSEAGQKRKLDPDRQRVKHPCILIFDSLAGDHHARVYSTLREYLKIEYKVKKKEERVLDKNVMPGIMPKVPQQTNYSDCGVFMLQYIENFYSDPIPTYDTNGISLKDWFPSEEIRVNKRPQMYEKIKEIISTKCPQNLGLLPELDFDSDALDRQEDEVENYGDGDEYCDDPDDEDYDEDDNNEESFQKPKRRRLEADKHEGKEEDHNYANNIKSPAIPSVVESPTKIPVITAVESMAKPPVITSVATVNTEEKTPVITSVTSVVESVTKTTGITSVASVVKTASSPSVSPTKSVGNTIVVSLMPMAKSPLIKPKSDK